MSFIVPIPPNPDENQYKANPFALSRANYDWMLKTKGKLEQSKSLANGIPIQSPVPGDIAYYANNLGWSRLAGGSPGQLLIYGTGTAPAWGNISSDIVAGTGIAITGTATNTIALANIAPNNLLANIGTASAAPSPTTLTNLIDSAIASVQGDILYRGTSSWSALAPGTNGQFLQTQGTSANPQWAAVSPTGTAGGYLSGTYPNPNVTKVLGVSTNNNASAGDVGEYISSTVVSTSAVALSSGTAANVTSIVLTPGDWDVAGNTAFVAGAATTATVFAGGIGTSAATLPTSPGSGAFSQLGISVSAGGVEPCFSVGEIRMNLAGTSTAYLVAQATFAISTMAAYGFIGARRRR